jgi:hypothetical protein
LLHHAKIRNGINIGGRERIYAKSMLNYPPTDLDDCTISQIARRLQNRPSRIHQRMRFGERLASIHFGDPELKFKDITATPRQSVEVCQGAPDGATSAALN